MKREALPSILGTLTLATGISLSSPSLASDAACASLASARFKDSRIVSTQIVRPDPIWEFPPSLFAGLARTDPTGTLNVKEPFCRVIGTIETEIGFEVWLPEDWNGKYQQVGNGAYTGSINYPTMGGALAKGYATASTDVGHVSQNSFETDWMVGHRQRVIDFGLRAHHVVSEIAKQIVEAYYDEGPAYSYFVGCSSGGWQALTEIQNYPGDFDGVVAGAPAHNFVRQNLRGTIVNQLSLARPVGDLSRTETQLVADAALKRCDPADGVTDGIISHPLQCDFDPGELQCKADETEACLTAAQLERVAALYGPIQSKGGLELYPGPTIAAALSPSASTAARAGAPPGPFASVPPTPDAPALAGPLANALREFGYAEAPTLATFDPDRDIPLMEELMNPVMSAVNPDLRKFKRRGGKVIAWHGWGDSGISPYQTLHYYDTVAAKVGGDMDDFYRIFFLPGMGHCGAGATGPDEFDVVAALENWVENDVAPTRIESAQYADGRITRTRPLCKYPEVPKYTGTGSTDDTQNFICSVP
jgi:feruloyl esterase